MAGSLSTTQRLPVIDFSKEDLKERTASWDVVRKEVVQALEEYGCFEAKYDQVTLELHNKVFKMSEEFFNLPEGIKQRFVDTSKPYSGYYAAGSVFEGMGITGFLDSQTIQTVFDVLWPEGKANFCEALHSYALGLSQLEQLITEMIFQSLGVEKYLESHRKNLNPTIRMIKYNTPNSDEPQIGISAHRDKNFLTILQQNEVDGLEVQLKDGNWIKVTPSASTFIVMVGESLLGWCNGRLYCPKHQVMMRVNETRYSIALFSAVKGIIQCPKELVDENYPLLFKPFDEVGLLCFTQTEEGRKAEFTLKAYCGVANDIN